MQVWAKTKGNIVFGAKSGLIVAIVFSGMASVVGLVRSIVSDVSFFDILQTLPFVVVLYLISGVLGGVFVGALAPLSKWLVGKAILGAVSFIPLSVLGYLFVSYINGRVEMPEVGIVLLTCFIGGGAGLIWGIMDLKERRG